MTGGSGRALTARPRCGMIRWRESEGRVAEAMATLGDELAAARNQYGEIKKLDETLFAKDYEL